MSTSLAAEGQRATGPGGPGSASSPHSTQDGSGHRKGPLCAPNPHTLGTRAVLEIGSHLHGGGEGVKGLGRVSPGGWAKGGTSCCDMVKVGRVDPRGRGTVGSSCLTSHTVRWPLTWPPLPGSAPKHHDAPLLCALQPGWPGLGRYDARGAVWPARPLVMGTFTAQPCGLGSV